MGTSEGMQLEAILKKLNEIAIHLKNANIIACASLIKDAKSPDDAIKRGKNLVP